MVKQHMQWFNNGKDNNNDDGSQQKNISVLLTPFFETPATTKWWTA